jgi:hypothetical protein
MRSMENSLAVHVELDLDPGADPIEGRMSVAGGPPEPFTGWMELASALERARSDGAAGVPASVSGGPPV